MLGGKEKAMKIMETDGWGSMSRWTMLVVLLFAAIGLCVIPLNVQGDSGASEKTSGKFLLALVTNIVDGDTIDVMIGDVPERVRYIGVNTPELRSKDEVKRGYANDAMIANSLIVSDRMVVLFLGVRERGPYNGPFDGRKRLLAHVITEDGVFVGAALVGSGLAKVATYPPNVRYKKLFKLLQERALRHHVFNTFFARNTWGKRKANSTLGT